MKKLEVLFDKTFLTILDIVQWSHNCKFHIASLLFIGLRPAITGS